MTAAFFLGLQHFNPIYLSGYYALSSGQWLRLDLLFLAGTFLLWWGMRDLPESGPKDDIGKIPARLMLLGILGLAAFMRLYGLGPLDLYPANFWDDQSRPLLDAFQISDYRHFIDYGYIEPGEPLYAYCLALVLYLFPKLPGIMVERLVSTAFDVTAVWLFYLLGKEFGKRRIGLLMASFGAICRAMLMMVLSYMRYPTLPMAMALLLLCCVRLFKNPTAKHFLYWSLSLSLCYYTYTAFRPLGPYFLLAVLVWVLLREKEKGVKPSHWVMGWGLAGLMVFLFLYLHQFFFKEGNSFRHLVVWLVEKARLQYLWGAGLSWVGWRMWREGKREGTNGEILNWTWSALLFALLVTPALLPMELRTRIQNLNALGLDASANPLTVAEVFLHRISLTLFTLFYSGGDRYDCELFGDPYFDVASLAFMLPGLVYVALRPRPLNLFILLAGVFGLVPHVLADPAGSRLIDCIVPFLLLGALGVDRIMEGASSAPWPRFWKTVVFLFWAGGIAFGATTNFEKIYFHFEKMPVQEVTMARQAGADSPQNRVYLAWVNRPENVMNEDKPIYRFSPDSNTVYLAPDEKAPDVVVLFHNQAFPQAGIVEKLKAQFPGAQVSQSPLMPYHPGDTTAIVRVLIPGADLDGDKSKVFHVERVPSGKWTRKFYESGYRLGCGLIVGEDRVENPTVPFLPGASAQYLGESSGRIETLWEAPTDGDYGFSVTTGQSLDLWVGDKLLLHLRPWFKGSYKATAYFKKGSYPLRLMVMNPISQGVPAVSIRLPGSDEWKPF